jgi:hypothetical protein
MADGEIDILLVPERLKELHRLLLLNQAFGVLERQIEEATPLPRDRLVGPGVERKLRLLERKAVGRKGQRRPAIDIARKLIENDDRCKLVFRRRPPGTKDPRLGTGGAFPRRARQRP